MKLNWGIALQLFFTAVWLVVITWCLMFMWWLRHIEPKWRGWFNRVREMTDKGDLPDSTDFAGVDKQISLDIHALSPLHWYQRWSADYPLPRVRSMTKVYLDEVSTTWPRKGPAA